MDKSEETTNTQHNTSNEENKNDDDDYTMPSIDEFIDEDIRLQEERRREVDIDYAIVEVFNDDAMNVDTSHPFMTDMVFNTDAEAIDWVMGVARRANVVLVRGRSDYSKNRNPYIKYVCERGGDTRTSHVAKSVAAKASTPTGKTKMKPRHSTTKKCGCQFTLVLKKDKKVNGWNVEVRNGVHNHPLQYDVRGHSFKGRLKREEKELVSQLTKVGTMPKIILQELIKRNPENVTAPQTIYNERVKLKKRSRENRTVMQEVFHLASKDDAFIRYTQSSKSEVEMLFWAHKTSLSLGRLFPYVLLMDCTYKTSYYDLPLFHVVGVTSTGKTFTMANAYMSEEKSDKYKWVLRQLREAMTQFGCSVPVTVITDRELALSDGVSVVFPESQHLLCRWHIQKCVKAKVRRNNKNEEAKKIMKGWDNIVYSASEEEFDNAIGEMRLLVNNAIFRYMDETWLSKYKNKFVSFWTDKVFHLGLTETSRVEGAHASLKGWLQSSANNDLATVWDAVKSMCDAQWNAIIASFELCRTKLSTSLYTQQCFRYLRGFVSSIALEKLNDELGRQNIIGESLTMCGCVSRKTLGIPCAHELSLLLKHKEFIPLDAIHDHWKVLSAKGCEFQADLDVQPYVDDFLHSFNSKETTTARLELIQRLREAHLPECTSLSQPPKRLNPRGRPSTRGKRKRLNDWKDDSSTKRVPSLFEFVEEAALNEEAEAVGPITKQKVKKVKKVKVVVEDEVNKGWLSCVLVQFQEFILGIKDVTGDGNCGYRAIALALGRPQTDYRAIRQELVDELESDMKHYDLLLMVEGDTKELIKNVRWRGFACKSPHWMDTPTMLWCIAEKYNACVVLFSNRANGTVTCFPTKKPPMHNPPVVICLLFQYDHYRQGTLKDGCPLPPVILRWSSSATEEARDGWMAHFETRLEAGRKLMESTSNLTPTVVELD